MIRYLYRSSTGALSHGTKPEQVREALKDAKGTLWIDVVHVPEQREQIGAQLRDWFGFHPLALDDALHESHSPRIDNWNEYLYLVFHALVLELNRTLDTQELDVFLGANYLVTIHEEPIRSLDHLWDQCSQGLENRWTAGPDRLLYHLTDVVVADYMPVVDGLDDEIDELENDIFSKQHSQHTISRIFRIRRTLLRLRRSLGSLREVFNRLARDDFPVIDSSDRIYFRDVYDHLVRLYDVIEGQRDLVTGAMDSYISVTSNRINEIMRTLTLVTVLFMPLTFLTGFFGMNFFGDAFNVDDPFHPGMLFWVTVLVMVLTPPFMLWWMARKGWLWSVENHVDSDREEG
jgi:magnesium transporter